MTCQGDYLITTELTVFSCAFSQITHNFHTTNSQMDIQNTTRIQSAVPYSLLAGATGFILQQRWKIHVYTLHQHVLVERALLCTYLLQQPDQLCPEQSWSQTLTCTRPKEVLVTFNGFSGLTNFIYCVRLRKNQCASTVVCMCYSLYYVQKSWHWNLLAFQRPFGVT